MYTTADCEKLYHEVKDLYLDDMKEKNSIKRSANSYSKRRRGQMKTEHDNLTNSQLKSLNGEVKTYQLGKPMTFEEFGILPDDLKVMYLSRLREKYGANNHMISEELFGIGDLDFISYLKKNNLPLGYSSNASELNEEAWNDFLRS